MPLACNDAGLLERVQKKRTSSSHNPTLGCVKKDFLVQLAFKEIIKDI